MPSLPLEKGHFGSKAGGRLKIRLRKDSGFPQVPPAGLNCETLTKIDLFEAEFCIYGPIVA